MFNKLIRGGGQADKELSVSRLPKLQLHALTDNPMNITVTGNITVSATLKANTPTYNLTIGNSYFESEDGWYFIEEYGFGASGKGKPITNGSISPTTFKGYNIHGFCVEQRYFADGGLEAYGIWLALKGDTQYTINQIEVVLNGVSYTLTYDNKSTVTTRYSYYYDNAWNFPAWTYLYQNRGKTISVTFI